MARILKIVNSPFYGFSAQIETIDHAMGIIGLDQLTEMILATTVIGSFKGIPKELVNIETFWEHSIACGLATQIIGKYRGEVDLDRFYVAGMLHDIGSLVIYKKASAKAKVMMEKCLREGVQLYKVEEEVLGFNHAEVGGALLKAWKLPQRLIEEVTYHHAPEKAKNFPVETSIVHVADIAVCNMGHGAPGESKEEPLDKDLLRSVGLSRKSIELLEQDVEERIRDTLDMFILEAK